MKHKKKPSVFVVSLGCPKNLVDMERYYAILLDKGYELTQSMENADLIFLNTCSFIEDARNESLDCLNEILEAKKDHQQLVVAGCMVDKMGEEIAAEYPEVNLWSGLQSFSQFGPQISQLASSGTPDTFIPLSSLKASDDKEVPWASVRRASLTLAHSTYLKISEGFDHSCSFCSIPGFKGPQRSVPAELLVAEARSLVTNGARELTLIGQDTIAYGRDLDPSRALNLRALLEKLNDIPDLKWLRVLYTYPTRLADEMLQAYQTIPKLVPYLDLPLQHLSDSVLELMRRGTPYPSILNHVRRLREAVPELVIRSTCIVGHPGETAKDFKLLQSRFAEIEVDNLGVFGFSDEEDTHSASLANKVPEKTRDKRVREMCEWAVEHCQSRAVARLGQTVELMVDQPIPYSKEIPFPLNPKLKCYVGRWTGQAPEIDGVVYFQGGDLRSGEILRAQLADALYPDYYATLEGKG